MTARVVIIGNVGRDPEIKQAGGTEVAKFSVAVTRHAKGEKVTDWHDVVAFGKQAEFVAKYITKGRTVAVDGKLQVETWSDKATGAKRSKHVIIADAVQGVGGKGDARDGDRPGFARAPEPYDAGDGGGTMGGDDDIPF
jgi:single-strand DNA-binding protein